MSNHINLSNQNRVFTGAPVKPCVSPDDPGLNCANENDAIRASPETQVEGGMIGTSHVETFLWIGGLLYIGNDIISFFLYYEYDYYKVLLLLLLL